MTFDIGHCYVMTFDIPWHLTFNIWHWCAMTLHTMTFDIWHLTFDIWHTMTFDIWHYIPWHLTFDIWHFTWLKVLITLALTLMILEQSYHIFTDGFWGYLQSKKIISDSLTHSLNNIGLRDASASKKRKSNKTKGKKRKE